MEKETLTGVVVFDIMNAGTKSEGTYPQLYTGFGQPFPRLYVKGDNPFENSKAREFDMKLVEATGSYDRHGAFVAETITEIDR